MPSMDSTATEFSKHEKFWFLDGNIILSTSKTLSDPHTEQESSSSRTQTPESSSSVGHKRRRIEDSSSLDGSKTFSSSKRIMFRVHKSVLSMHSPVFNDMFTLPDTAACSELVGRQAEGVNGTSGSVTRHMKVSLSSSFRILLSKSNNCYLFSIIHYLRKFLFSFS